MSTQTISVRDLRLRDYKVIIMQPNVHAQKQFDVSQAVESITWDYDIDQPVENYTVQFLKVPDLLRIVQPGYWMFIYGWRPNPASDMDYGIIKQGIIWTTELSTPNRGTIKITAHDVTIYLTNNKGSHRLENGEKASDFIKRIAPKYGVQLDKIADTKLGMPYPLPFINQSIFDMFATALQNTRDLGFSGRVEGDAVQFGALRYYLQSVGMSIALIEKKNQPNCWLFQSGDSGNPGDVLEATNRFTLDNYRNVIKVYSTANPDTSGTDPTGLETVEGDPVLTAASPPESSWATDPDILKFGMLSESVSFQNYSESQMAEPDLPAQAQWQADDMLRRLKKLWNEGSISTFNIPTIRAGDAVYVNVPEIAMTNRYYVKSGSHTVTAQAATMTLNVQFEDLLPFVYKSKRESQADVLNLGL
jgi:hypothetical protein